MTTYVKSVRQLQSVRHAACAQIKRMVESPTDATDAFLRAVAAQNEVTLTTVQKAFRHCGAWVRNVKIILDGPNAPHRESQQEVHLRYMHGRSCFMHTLTVPLAPILSSKSRALYVQERKDNAVEKEELRSRNDYAKYLAMKRRFEEQPSGVDKKVMQISAATEAAKTMKKYMSSLGHKL